MSQQEKRSPHLFVAIPIGVEVGMRLNAWAKSTFGESSFRRWTDPRDVHFTLKFLGSVEEERIAEINAALREALARETPFALELAGAAIFGLPEAPRVLFAEPASGSAGLSRLADATEEALAPLGFAREKRSFRAHLTLARQYAADAPVFEPAKLASAPALSVGIIDRAVLYRTHMNKSPMYEEVSSFPLFNTKDP
ncbi:RNA 2',3'-cyclic phosphodiesterase [Saccharibacillus sp. JS10]|uniref:RNA 2',3'-cyclic phosphodiesterase n=1 Tax=Saccharibacillus sp. JS10 TaxID=2950552 RepID=UPI00210C42FC|nr:RNA 2',3'-cyclic phosphodiesterase [Saccharibacillus sp. JS10]MCQ4086692.1 RNA 2',3'-cyclic phosphodiesterase [Saccharibacillus sp. JS10]